MSDSEKRIGGERENHFGFKWASDSISSTSYVRRRLKQILVETIKEVNANVFQVTTTGETLVSHFFLGSNVETQLKKPVVK